MVEKEYSQKQTLKQLMGTLRKSNFNFLFIQYFVFFFLNFSLSYLKLGFHICTKGKKICADNVTYPRQLPLTGKKARVRAEDVHKPHCNPNVSNS